MVPHKQPRWRGRADVQACALACGGIAAAAVTSAAACALCPQPAAWAAAAACALALCGLSAAAARVLFRRIANPSFQDLSNTDVLTGLKSRSAFELDLSNLQAGRGQRTVGVLVLDLDNLKQINDRLGHRAGDRYLQLAARALREGAEAGTLCYRVGGDELAVLIPGGSEAQAAALAQRTRAIFSQMRPAHLAGALSLAVGWACFRPGQGTLWDAYARADRRMYADKRGRRRTGAPEHGGGNIPPL